MTVKLSSLRVTAEMDVSQYVRAAADKTAADKSIVASSKEVGAALAAQDIAASKLGAGVVGLSRSFIGGYSEAEKFEKAIRSIGRALDNGMDAGRAAAALDGVYRKFGRVADAAQLSKQGFVSLAPLITSLNSQYEAMATVQERAARAAQNLATAQMTQKGINERLGIGQGTISARASASVFEEADAARLAAIAKMRAEQIGAAFGEDLNARMIRGVQKSARDSAAVFDSELNRIDEIAKAKATQAGQYFGQDLNDRLVAGVRKAAKDSAAVFEAEFARLDQIAGQKSQEAMVDTQARIAAAYGIGAAPKSAAASGAVFQERFAEEASLASRAKSLIATHLPEQAEMERSKTYMAEINDLGAKGLLTRQQVADAQRAENLRHQQALDSIKGMYIAQGKYASGVGLARHEVVNLGRQLQDVVITLQAGQPLSTILLQQGSQIADIFATSRANFSGFAVQAAGWARTFLASTAGVVSGVALVGVTAAYAGLKYADAQREVERSLQGVGRASGISVSQINAMAEATAKAKSISVASAREVASVYAATGRIGGGITGDLTGITKDYAAQTGQDLTAAAQELAKAFADPTKGADALNEKLGFLDARTRSYIRTLADQNDRTGAQKALLDAMRSSIDGAAERVSWLSKAWTGLKNAVSNGVDAVGNAVAGQLTLEERLNKTLQERAKLAQGWTARSPRSQAAIAALDEQAGYIQEDIRRNSARRSVLSSDAQSAQESLRIQEIVSSTEAWTSELKKLKAELKAIDDALANQNTAGRFSDVGQVQRVAEAYRNAIASSLAPEQKLRQEGELITKSIMARTLAEQQAVAIMRENLAMSGQKLTNAERELQIANRLLEVNANAAREAREMARTATNSAAIAGLRPYERAQAEIEQRYRDARERLTTQGSPAGDDLRLRTFTGGGGGNAAATGVDPSFRAKVEALIEAVGDSGARLTSGFRSREKQQELYDLYGPGKAARPGSSQHEHGTAMDYVFSSPAARQRAMELAQQYGLRALSSNGGAVHFDTGARGGAGAVGSGGASADLARARNAELSALNKEQIGGALRAANDDIKRQNELLGLQEASVKRTAYELGRYAKEQELTNAFQQQGVKVGGDLKAEIDRIADAAGRLAERQASVRLTQDVMFERSQIGRTPEEAQIASRLRGTGISMESAIADQMRFNQALETTKSLSADAMKGFISDMRQGKSVTEALTNALNRVADKLVDMAVNQTIAGFFGGSTGSSGGVLGGLIKAVFGGGSTAGLYTAGAGGYTGFGPFLPSARGNVFANDNVQPFARGGALLYGPTQFRFGRGGSMRGLGGEAGTEAIMPLRRDNLGRLGVTVVGGQGQQAPAQVSMPVTIINNQPVDVQTRPDGNGGLEVVINSVENRFADRAARNRGPFAPMVASGPGRG